ncbi:hypothetical protein C2E23DRAFT_888512 [Lenzites betulinus]|nr:hypothetical protein C2E23DRAFT_888512 [Lenzites betulinus]
MDPSAAALDPSAATDPGVGASSAALPSADSTLGALLLGTCFGFMLYGLMLHQAFRYYHLYPTDRFHLKWLVTIIVIMESFHMSLWAIASYEYLVANYLDPVYPALTHWFVQTTVPFTGSAILVCQIFYAARVYYFGPKWQYRATVYVVIVLMLSFVGWTAVAAVKSYQATTSAEFAHSTWLISVGYGHAVVSDIILAGALIYILHQNRTGIKKTDTVLDTLIVYTINTGLLTTIFGILVFVFGLTNPDNLVYAGLSIPSVKLYSNSVLAMLNSRRSLSAKMMGGGFDPGSISLGNYRPSAAASHSRTGGITTVTRTQTVTVDVNGWPGKISSHVGSDVDEEKGTHTAFDSRNLKRSTEGYDEDELGFAR